MDDSPPARLYTPLPLTPKERIVADLILKGRTNLQIAKEVDTTVQVIKNYASVIYKKYRVHSRAQFALISAEH